MSVSVIDGLEVVYIEHQHDKPVIVALQTLEFQFAEFDYRAPRINAVSTSIEAR